MRTMRRSIWEDLQISSASNDYEVVQYIDELKRHGRDFGISQKNLKRLQLLDASPYFGRIDFYDEEFATVVTIYIGIASLIDEESKEHLIYDWRAPIASMFYDFGVGKAEYESPAGTITGDIILKRQYQIKEGELRYIFDSDLTIDDEILQDVLSKHADDKMRNIVYSIQKEQNLAIRDEQTQVLMVQGPAGSGKTSIALHRAAYLLYRHHQSLDASNIVIFSPNRVFSDYISHVLPQLGEENIGQATMQEYAYRILGTSWDVEDLYSQLEELFMHEKDQSQLARTQGIEFKSSKTYFETVQTYLNYVIEQKIKFSDLIVWDQVLLKKTEFEQLFRETYQYLPIKKRLDKIRRRIHFLLDPMKKQRIRDLVLEKENEPDRIGESSREVASICVQEVHEQLQSVWDQVNAWLVLDTLDCYCELFSNISLMQQLTKAELPTNWSEICQQTLYALGNQQVHYEDLAPLLYLKGRIEGWPTYEHIRHVIIDEAQDYSVFHYEIFKNVFPKSTFTILGDFNQAIHPYLVLTSYHDLAGVFASYSHKMIELTKSYRSTQEISAFTRAILAKDQEGENVARSGDKPQVIQVDAESITVQLIKDITESCNQQAQSIAVICKTTNHCQEVATLLEGKIEFALITKEDEHFTKGVVVVPVYLAKGLEFDAVIVSDGEASCYGKDTERKLFYTACTRALHQLFIYYQVELTPFVTQLDSKLYESIS